MRNLIIMVVMMTNLVATYSISQETKAGFPSEPIEQVSDKTDYDIILDRMSDIVGSEKLAAEIIELSWSQMTLFYDVLNRLEMKSSLECLKDILISMMHEDCVVETQSLHGQVKRYTGLDYITSISTKRTSNNNFQISISPYIEIDTSNFTFSKYQIEPAITTFLFKFPITVTQYYQRGSYIDITKKEVLFAIVINYNSSKHLDTKIHSIRVIEVMPY